MNLSINQSPELESSPDNLHEEHDERRDEDSPVLPEEQHSAGLFGQGTDEHPEEVNVHAEEVVSEVDERVAGVEQAQQSLIRAGHEAAVDGDQQEVPCNWQKVHMAV